MGIIIAAVLLSAFLIVPSLTGVSLSGRGRVLRILGALLVLPLLVFWIWIGRNAVFDITVGDGQGWKELALFLKSFELGVIGAIIGVVGRVLAGR